VKERSLDWRNGIGKIFVIKIELFSFIIMNLIGYRCFKGQMEFNNKSLQTGISTQIDLLKTFPQWKRLSEKRKREIELPYKFGYKEIEGY